MRRVIPGAVLFALPAFAITLAAAVCASNAGSDLGSLPPKGFVPEAPGEYEAPLRPASEPQPHQLLPASPPAEYQTAVRSTPEPVHVILFIGDGMSLASEIAASRYLFGTDDGLVWHDFEFKAFVTTWDVDTYNRYAKRAGADLYSPLSFDAVYGYDPSKGGEAPWPLGQPVVENYFLSALPDLSGEYAVPATDSASAATAIATGMKTDAGNIAWAAGDAPDGALITVAEKMRNLRGMATGIVSTVPFSHATPAAFAAHNVYRGNTAQISHEIITSTKPEVVIGAGHPDWNTGYITTTDLQALRNSSEYMLVERRSGTNGGTALLAASSQAAAVGKKLFGLFGGTRACFEPPRPVHSPGAPSFVVEEENPSLAEAVEAALNVLRDDPEGFFLMAEQGDIDWANHYNDYHWLLGSMWDLNEAVKAAIRFVDRPGDNIDWGNTLLIVTADHCTGYLRLDREKLTAGYVPQMLGEAYHHSYPGGEVSYGATVHTNELVTLYAQGEGAQLLDQQLGLRYPGTRIIDNTDIHAVLETLLSVVAAR